MIQWIDACAITDVYAEDLIAWEYKGHKVAKMKFNIQLSYYHLNKKCEYGTPNNKYYTIFTPPTDLFLFHHSLHSAGHPSVASQSLARQVRHNQGRQTESDVIRPDA